MKRGSHDQFFDLFVEELADIYDGEIQIIHALPKLIQAASTRELKDAFNQHLQETKVQKQRLEEIFFELYLEPFENRCEGIEGLLMEGKEIIKKRLPPAVKDAALIGAAQKVEHYEIASYGTLRTYAELLELDDIADLLQETLDEEYGADKKLNQIAKGSWFTTGVNAKAIK
jgi:ferritin-like metal-binding protein YciE